METSDTWKNGKTKVRSLRWKSTLINDGHNEEITQSGETRLQYSALTCGNLLGVKIDKITHRRLTH
jgi:hypothetical protein